MAYLHQVNAKLQEQAVSVALPRGRRRLSDLLRQHADPNRSYIVSVINARTPVRTLTDNLVWKADFDKRRIGPSSHVTIIYIAGGGRGGAGKQIASLVAMAALLFVAPYLAAAFPFAGTAAALTPFGKLLSAGIVIAGGYAISLATRPKAEDGSKPLYGVSGGGNAAQPGARIPRLYGEVWTQPPLTQPDSFEYDGEDVILKKRMTVSLGPQSVLDIRNNDATMWNLADGLRPPYAGGGGSSGNSNGSGVTTAINIIQPGGNAILVRGSTYSSPSVSGGELIRFNESPFNTGPFPASPVGQNTALIQIDYTVPACYRQDKKGTHNWSWAAIWEYAPCDNDNNPTGPFITLLAQNADGQNTTTPQRVTRKIVVPSGRYVVRSRNLMDEREDHFNAVTWDGLRSHDPTDIVRPHVTEIEMIVRSGKELANPNFSNLWVKTIAVLPHRAGGVWTTGPTKSAIAAARDVLQNSFYGGDLADQLVDLQTFESLAANAEFDEFSDVITGPVSLWEAMTVILGTMRAEPVKIGAIWSILRDEPRLTRAGAVTRRQIVMGTSSLEYNFQRPNGETHYVVEYKVNGDPRLRNEAEAYIGSQTRTPRRMAAAGVSTYAHALQLARWRAVVAAERRVIRQFTIDRRGITYMRGDPLLVDFWFTSNGQAAGVTARAGSTLSLDTPIDFDGPTYLTLRDRKGAAFGPMLITAGGAANQIVIDGTDLAAAEAAYSTTLGAVLANDNAERTTAIVGKVVEQQQRYLIDEILYEDRDAITITAIKDSEAVWDYLDVAVPSPPAVPSLLVNERVPDVRRISARAVVESNTLFLAWGVGRSVYAARVIVEMQYPGQPWERVSDSSQTSGKFQIRHVDPDAVNLLRAFGVNAEGVPGPAYQTEFKTRQPKVPVASLVDEVANELFIDAPARYRALAAEHYALAHEVGEFSDWITERVDLAKDDSNEYFKANSSAITTLQVRTGEIDGLLVTQAAWIVALDSSIEALDGTVAGQADALQLLTTRVGETETGIDTLAAYIVSLESTVDQTAGTGAWGGATALGGLTTRVVTAEDNITATADFANAISVIVSGTGPGPGGLEASVTELGLVTADLLSGSATAFYGFRGVAGTSIFEFMGYADSVSSTLDLRASEVRLWSDDGAVGSAPLVVSNVGGVPRVTFGADVYFLAAAYMVDGDITTNLLEANAVTTKAFIPETDVHGSLGTIATANLVSTSLTTTGKPLEVEFSISGSSYGIGGLGLVATFEIVIDSTVVKTVYFAAVRGGGTGSGETSESNVCLINTNVTYRTTSLTAGAHTFYLKGVNQGAGFSSGLYVSGKVMEYKA